MLLTKEVTVNLHYREAPVVLEAAQGDSGRALSVRLLAGDTDWALPVDACAVIQYECADGTGGTYDALPDGTAAYSVNDDRLLLRLASQVCAVPGCTKLQVTIFDSTSQLSTFPVEIRVLPQISGEAADGSYTNLQQWLCRSDNKEEIVNAVLAALPNGDEVSY